MTQKEFKEQADLLKKPYLQSLEIRRKFSEIAEISYKIFDETGCKIHAKIWVRAMAEYDKLLELSNQQWATYQEKLTLLQQEFKNT